MVRFSYVALFPFMELEVVSTDDGEAIQVFNGKEEISWDSLAFRDRMLIRQKIEEEATRQFCEFASDEQQYNFVDDMEKEHGKYCFGLIEELNKH